ncbi:hypothetical protein ACFWG5_34825 [Streptomyces hydrogenans]|uniref:hypothetical protein n=1 Tax=Streptomyces TaxID=1883 RepID=UPI00363F2377
MARTQTRPPTFRSGRPPKGPRPVATAREKLLTDLRAASAHLRATDAPELADTVDTLLTPAGWGQLRRAVEPDTDNRNEMIRLSEAAHRHYEQAATAAGSTLTADVSEGLRAFADGSFSPAGYPRREAGSRAQSHMNVRIADDLRADFAAAVTARTTELGYKTTIGHVAKAWLAHKYPLSAK